MFTEKQLSHELVFKGIITDIYHDKVELPNGRTSYREICTHPGAVVILPIDGDELLFVRQFRYAIGCDLLELPAGKVEPGEDHALTAKRELREETGMSCHDLEYLGKVYSSPGIMAEVLHVYCARNMEFIGECPDEDEFLSCQRIKISHAFDMVANGEMCDGKSICVLAMARAKGIL